MLLEVMIAILLLALAAGGLGTGICKGIEEKRFNSAGQRLFVELEALRHLAVNSQADWLAILEKRGDCFVLHKTCPEMDKAFFVSWKAPCELSFNQESTEAIAFQFSSSGKCSPKGILTLASGKKTFTLTLPDQFSVFEGESKL